jgi:MoaA/NifB/PqqE/SkfB family radical SAM enzyme
MGNLNQHSLKELFNSDWIKDFRTTVVDQSFKFCDPVHCGNIWNLDHVDSFDRIEKNPLLPTHLFLQDIDRNCNLACPSCRNDFIYSKEVNKTAETILNNLVDVYKDYQGIVFLYGDHAGDAFASSAYKQFFARPDFPKCFKLCINTNGNLLTKNLDLIEKIRDQIDYINVSFDASNSHTYKIIRGGNFNIVCEGVTALIKMGIRVHTNCVVQYKNYREILEYRNLCRELQISQIGLNKIKFWPHMSMQWWIENNIDDNPNVDYDFLRFALSELKNDMCVLDGGLESLLNKKGRTSGLFIPIIAN